MLFFAGLLVAAQVAPAGAAPQDTLAQRAIEMHSGMIAEVLPGTTPTELDKTVPLPAGTLLGSVVLTPLQSYAEHGSPGMIELYYDMAAPAGAASYVDNLKSSGWQARTVGQGSTVMCRAGSPAIVVTSSALSPPPYGNRLEITVYRSRPGWTPCQ